jgi:hypothetical protein
VRLSGGLQTKHADIHQPAISNADVERVCMHAAGADRSASTSRAVPVPVLSTGTTRIGAGYERLIEEELLSGRPSRQ